MAPISNMNPFKSQSKQSNVAPFKQHHFINTLPVKQLAEILTFSEGDHLCELMPEAFGGKRVLYFNDQRHKFVFKKLLAREPDYLLNYGYQGPELTNQSPGYVSIYADMNRMPIKAEKFDVVICPFALEAEQFSPELLATIKRVLKNGGRLILSLRHPGLEKLVFNQNPSVNGVPENSVSAFYKLLKKNSLYVDDMVEGKVDLNLKPFFTLDGVYDHYHEYKNMPLTLMFNCVKFER